MRFASAPWLFAVRPIPVLQRKTSLTRNMTPANGRNNMSVAELEKVTKAWLPISRAVRVPHTEEDYRDLVQLLDGLTDEVGEVAAATARFTNGCARSPHRKIRRRACSAANRISVASMKSFLLLLLCPSFFSANGRIRRGELSNFLPRAVLFVRETG